MPTGMIPLAISNEQKDILDMSKEELKVFLGEPVYDRFVVNCTSLTFTGESYRKRERED